MSDGAATSRRLLRPVVAALNLFLLANCGARTGFAPFDASAPPFDAAEDGHLRDLGDDATSPCTGCAWRCDDADRCDDAIQVTAGGGSTCALSGAGVVDCWGYGVLRAGDDSTTVHTQPVQIEALAGVVQIEDSGHICARVAASAAMPGQVMCWGTNAYGELGDGTHVDRTTPVAVVGMTDAINLSVSYGGACAVRSNGHVACWGYNPHGRLGDGSTVNRAFPEDVPLLEDAVEVAMGGVSTCALQSDGVVSCWGGNFSGQLGNGTLDWQPTPGPVIGLDDATMLFKGPEAVCARRRPRADGTVPVSCWGSFRDPTSSFDQRQ